MEQAQNIVSWLLDWLYMSAELWIVEAGKIPRALKEGKVGT